ncbi:MAG TPA: hypothetical protein VF808_15800 [Ktedonobacterales bacterium]
MDRCERCGANALNVHGVCRNCGWQAPEVAYGESPSLGETRPADTALPPGQASFYPRASGYQGPTSGATAAAPGQRSSRSIPTGGSAPRFCGVCGARITGSEAFCGQCGSPISAAPATSGVPSGPGRYQIGADDWGTEDAEAFTEALPGPPALGAPRTPYNNDPYGRPYTPYGAGAQQQAPGLSRSAKVTIGALFLGASVLIAIITITLAVIWFSHA